MIVKPLLMMAVLLACFQVRAQNWTGNVDSDWNNASNWSSWPLGGQDISINPLLYTGNAASPVISANSVFSPGAVLIENGGLLTIGANLSTQDDVEVLGAGSQLIVNDGTFNVNLSDGGRLIIDLGATMVINGGNTQVGERFIAGEDALVTINNGAASSGQRILMDLGGRFIQHSGTVSTAETFAMADGSANFNSGYVLNGGTLTVTGEMGFENEAGLFEPSFVQNGGTMTVNGDVFWFGEVPGSGTPRWIIHDGTATVTGTIQNMPLSTVNLYLKIDGTGQLITSGPGIDLLHPEDSIVMADNASLELTGSLTLTNPGVVHATGGVTTVSGAANFAGSGTYQLHDLEIAPSVTLNYQTINPLKVSGNLAQFGTLLMNGHPAHLNGVEQQELSGTGNLGFSSLTVENTHTDGVEILVPATVTGNLQLNDGVVHTYTAFPVEIADDGTTSGGSPDSYVSGPLFKSGDDAFVFPIGKNGKWRRLSMTAPATTASQFSAEYMDQSYTYVTPVNSPLSAVSSLEYWQFNQEIGATSVQLGLFWEDATASAINDCNELSIGYANGTSWDNITSLASGVCSGNGSGSVVSTGMISDFGAFTLGFFSGVTVQEVSICSGDVYTVGSSVYDESGTYVDVLTDVNANDSIVLTTLSVIVPDLGIIAQNGTLESTASAADAWQWLDCGNGHAVIAGATTGSYTPLTSGSYALEVTESGCADTSVCIDFTIVDTTICTGEVYTVGSNNYSVTGTYTDQLLADSVVLTNLDVFMINTAVSVTGLTLETLNTGADTYQWLDCATGQEIAGANQATYTTNVNGSFAVIIQESGCADTSVCEIIDWAAVLETEPLTDVLKIVPNPVVDQFRVQGVNGPDVVAIRLLDATGSVIKEYTQGEDTLKLPVGIQQGMYLLEVETTNGWKGIARLINL